MSEDTLQRRIRTAIGNRTNREVGEMTGCHPETVRRYVTGQAPSVEFLQRLAEATGLDPGWLISGKDRQVNAEALLAAINTLDTRLDALEHEIRVLHNQCDVLQKAASQRSKVGIFPSQPI